MDVKKALQIIAAQCSKKEYCRFDITVKLQRWELSEKDIAEVMAFLVKNHFVDDERYARAYAKDKFRFNRWGKLKIELMLRQKQIPDHIVAEALRALPEEDYDEVCISLLKQKSRSLKEEDSRKRKAKLFRYALARGFSYEVVARCLKRL